MLNGEGAGGVRQLYESEKHRLDFDDRVPIV